MGAADYDCELDDAIKDLLDEGALQKGTAPFGIAQQVIWRGYESLTPEQRFSYDGVVVPALRLRGEKLDAIHALNAVAP